VKAQNNISRLLKIMDDLRLNCPWDKKQTLDSLKRLTVEETYELNDAIENKNFENIKEELGDLLLHIVFYSKIASEKNHFNFNDVVEKICEKLIERHPHVYGELKLRDEDEVKHNWEMIKKQKTNKSLLSGVPKTLPPISKAYRVQEKVSSVGFDWKKSESVIEKIFEEFNEFQSAIRSKNKNDINDEFGDILFSLINYARHNNIDPEQSLNSSTEKFKKRFNTLEKIF
jgi:XTP/dITP diphosphohydrolase